MCATHTQVCEGGFFLFVPRSHLLICRAGRLFVVSALHVFVWKTRASFHISDLADDIGYFLEMEARSKTFLNEYHNFTSFLVTDVYSLGCN
ncbi:hypothetical protein CEXT_312791 [Caerostris extrusa]|uniref:Uncharacterized protein n=1 Tax=Caerostris extrusa TaxID=172846 RepID=A0AAV4S5Z3_CAEEX|nr:hypothetical protein CEXT_312791 [Caerostris extrusa]